MPPLTSLDLHAAPGKQNNDAHGGTSNPPTFFSNSRNRDHAVNVLHILLRTLNHVCQTHEPRLTNVVGIELLNEPHPPSDTALKDWYTTAINKLSGDDPTMPLYLGECWRTDSYAKYLKSLSSSTSTLLVLDHHLYRCFTGSDITTTAMQHAGALADPNAPVEGWRAVLTIVLRYGASRRQRERIEEGVELMATRLGEGGGNEM